MFITFSYNGQMSGSLAPHSSTAILIAFSAFLHQDITEQQAHGRHYQMRVETSHYNLHNPHHKQKIV